jgi:hypothetical protein
MKTSSPLLEEVFSLQSARGWRSIVDNDNLLRLLAGENQSNNPTEKRNTEQDIDDDSSGLILTIFSDGSDGGQEVYV